MKYNKVYVVAPYHYATGGVELAHQLVDYLRNKGQKAYLVFSKNLMQVNYDVSDIMPQYQIYNLEVAHEVEDNKDNMLVLPEVAFDIMDQFENITIGCWWMSVDNRYQRVSFRDSFCFASTLIAKAKFIVKWVLNMDGFRENKNSDAKLLRGNARIWHFYQSHYAQFHLYKKGFSQVLPLSDYVNDEFSNDKDSVEKENIVLYNPKKGYAFTQHIIASSPDLKFVPLIGMDREQLKDIMRRSKLYIDFGHFPGKDRLFREAALNGCCIMTGKNGASRFYEDVPIWGKYKFDTKKSSIRSIVSQIHYIFENYNECVQDFKYLVRKTKAEKAIFFKEIDEVFDLS